MFFAGGPGRPIPIHDYVQESLADIDSPKQVRAGFAYATSDGLGELCAENGNDWRDDAESKWIIGLDHGLTSIDVLEELDNHPNTEVRVIFPGDGLTRETLNKRPRFHAKLLYLESGSTPDQEHLITTSANMTGSALGRLPTNFEVGLVKSRNSGLSDDEVDTFEDWWDLAWSESVQVTDELIEAYTVAKAAYQDENPGVSEYENTDTVEYASDADHLYLETLKMTAGSRNQLELNQECTRFFSDSGTLPNFVDITCGDFGPDECTLTTRTTDPPFGVEIGLLYLPTEFDYQYSVVHLEKAGIGDSGNPVFEMTIADSHDDVVDDWRNHAESRGGIGETRGGREYGYY